MKFYAIRESWDFEIYDLIEFFLEREDAQDRVDKLNREKSPVYNDYEVEEIEAK